MKHIIRKVFLYLCLLYSAMGVIWLNLLAFGAVTSCKPLWSFYVSAVLFFVWSFPAWENK